jgi:CDP-diacylglycerol--glycerol-3-phosphate 3-phosphatidyltransferase
VEAHILDRMTARTVSAPLAQIPNALTLGRLALIPVFVALVLASDGGHSWPAAVVFGVAGVTDQVDGYLARRWHVESAFGKLADPLADRLMIDAAVLLLWHADRLPWIALAIPLRDLVALAGTPLLLGRGYEFQVNLAGKAATWLLYLSLAMVMVTRHGTDWPLWIFWAGVVVALAALAQYVVKARREVLA